MESDPIQIAWYVEGKRFACLFFNVMTRIGPYTLLVVSVAAVASLNGPEPAMANPAVETHECGYTSGITGQAKVTIAIDKDNHVLCTIDAGSLSGPHSIEVYGISPVAGSPVRIIFSFDSAQ
ncbi:MAG: hypothetical protein ACREA4_07490 [Nitrososphaera sp.]